jgi:hypothetical protein
MARVDRALDVHPFIHHRFYIFIKLVIPNPLVFVVFCSFKLILYFCGLEKRGKNRYMKENQSLERDRAYCAALSKHLIYQNKFSWVRFRVQIARPLGFALGI